MKYNRLIVTLALAVMTSVSAFAATQEYVASQVIVKYKPNAFRTRIQMQALYSTLGVEAKQIVMSGVEQLSLRTGVSVEETVQKLNQNSMVEYAQPNYIIKLMPNRVKQVETWLEQQYGVKFQNGKLEEPTLPGIPCIPGFDIPGCDPNVPLPCLFPGFPPGCEGEGFPMPGGPGEDPSKPSERPELTPAPEEVNPPVEDPEYSKLYGMDKIQAKLAWEKTKGSKEMVVAVIDTGIDYNHEDLSFNVWRNPNPTQNDIVGFDFVHNDGLPYDDNEHGTHTFGTIGAVGNNGKAIVGVNQRVSVMGLKFLSGSGSGSTADAVKAIDYAIKNGAKVLSNSWGGPADPDNKVLYDAIERAKAADVLFIAAAGNDGADNDGSRASYPAAFDNENLIAVAATDKSDKMAFFSNYGKKTTHLAAPGVDIYSTVPGNRYAALSGTSMACPHVAGAAALVWSYHPTWTFKQVKEALLKSVDVLPGFDKKIMTGGRLNVLKALDYKPAEPEAPVTPVPAS